MCYCAKYSVVRDLIIFMHRNAAPPCIKPGPVCYVAGQPSALFHDKEIKPLSIIFILFLEFEFI
jgi:hypothetical protein